ncbi:MAG: histidinol-phosphate transaminase [Bdellovibrionales bacterium]|nr:histidinol-phosphate transaminase [Bdellovibrionales bacterium]
MLKVSKHIQDLKAYKPGMSLESIKNKHNLSKFYKLSSNENLAGCSNEVKKVLVKAIESAHFYPDPQCTKLKQNFSDFYKIKTDYLSFGNGSNEIIDILIRTYCNPIEGEKVLTSQGAFIAYKVCAQAARLEVKQCPLNKNLGFDIDAIKKAINEDAKIKIVFIANPNNPTGTYVSKDELLSLVLFCKDKNILLIIDEAYNEFVTATDFPKTLDWVKTYNHVAVIRTLSKAYALAGLRLGVLIANPEIISYFDKVRNPFNVNSLVQAGASAAIKNTDYLKQIYENNKQGLSFFYKSFDSLKIDYTKSQANFILFDCKQDAQDFCKQLLTKALVLRPLLPYGFKTQVRMTVGPMEQNQKAVKILQDYFNKA